MREMISDGQKEYEGNNNFHNLKKKKKTYLNFYREYNIILLSSTLFSIIAFRIK